MNNFLIVAWLYLNSFLYVFLTYKNEGNKEAEADQEMVWHQNVHFCLITEDSFSDQLIPSDGMIVPSPLRYQ